MNNFIKKAGPAPKHPVEISEEENKKDTSKPLSQVEGILTSSIQIKYLRDDTSYYWAFFQLEGIDQDIPVIFRLQKPCPYCPPDQTKCKWSGCGYLRTKQPNIPPQSKVLLKGNWAESDSSNRPSFTCLEYQILAPPAPPTIKSLQKQISQLLTTSLEKQSEWKQRVECLFRKQKDLQEAEKLTKLGEEYLQAYLLLRRAHYSNYQDNLLVHNQFNQDQYLAKISQEIEEISYQIRAYEAVSRRNSSISDLPKVNTDYQSKEKDLF